VTRRPQGFLFDYGGTLVEELEFNPRAGIELLLERAAHRSTNVGLEAILERADRAIFREARP
jgi:hypothetical protein